MPIFWDTSAVVPLLLEEPRTDEATRAWSDCEEAWAWEWMRVEAEAALARRNANAAAWQTWRRVSASFRFVGLEADRLPTLCAFNRGLALRAADAAHLFLFDRLVEHVPNLRLLTYDDEMTEAARRLGLAPLK